MTNEDAIRHIECVAKNAAEGGYDSAFCSAEALILVAESLKAKPCEDAISRQAMLDGLAGIAKAKARSDAQKALMGRVMFFTEQLPPVTPKPKMGKWIRQGNDYTDYYECEHCGIAVGLDDIKNYCPNCGAKMEGASEWKQNMN